MISEPVNSVEEAYEYVGYYMQRWKIERVWHRENEGAYSDVLNYRGDDTEHDPYDAANT
jgi:hypothetical protein